MRVFKESEYKVVDKSWGLEQWIVNNDKYCMKLLVCLRDKWSSNGKYHLHPVKDETFYVMRGALRIDIDFKSKPAESFYLFEQCSMRIPDNTGHRFVALSDVAIVIEVSTTHRDEDSIRYEKESNDGNN